MKTVYIETTIPSFYNETRPEPEMVARKLWPRQWWDDQKDSFQCYISEAVIEELSDGNYPSKDDTVSLVDNIDILYIDDNIIDIVNVYLQNYLMPRERLGDAVHLALASYYKCDFLLTWNCVHIANANKYQHIKIINERMDLFTPMIVTPLELVSEKDNED